VFKRIKNFLGGSQNSLISRCQKMPMTKNDIIIAQATPSGLGGIGVVRLSGTGCIELAQNRFSNKNLKSADGKTIHYGYFYSSNKEIIDECLLSVFRAPNSYTKEDTIEISCHGSPYILSQIIKTLINDGARQAEGGEFTLRSFLNGQLNLSQAEAVADLINAENYFSHKLALDQLRGGYANELLDLRKKMIEFASLIELELDFGEEDVEFASRAEFLEDLGQLTQRISTLKNSFDLGNSLKNGIAVVIAGKPNAGKSTLLNALLKTDRAIVSDIPGTTRDTIDDYLIIDGVKFLLTDTAGIRESKDEIEQRGIEKTFEKIDAAQIILYVVDVTELSPEETWREIESIENKNLILILNKMDLYRTLDPKSYVKVGFISEDKILPISAINKMNIRLIKNMLTSLVLTDQAKDTSIVTNVRHYESLQNAHSSLLKVKEGINQSISSDLLAIDLRQALHHLGLITGEIHTDDLLESIFSSFCIGK